MTDHPAAVFSFTVHRFNGEFPDLIRKNDMELQADEIYKFIVCSACYNAVHPVSVEQFKNLMLTIEDAEDGQNFRCPRCSEVVYWVSETGSLDFGI